MQLNAGSPPSRAILSTSVDEEQGIWYEGDLRQEQKWLSLIEKSEKIIEHKVWLLNLAEELGNGSQTLLEGKLIWKEKFINHL